MQERSIGANEAGQRLDKFLAKAFPALPASLAYKLIRKKKIKVNRARAERGQMLAVGDTIQLFVAPEFLAREPKKETFLALTPHLDILYEDENILLLNKRPGMIVHEDAAESANTLIAHVQAYLYQKGEYNPQNEQSFAPALCNRIDRNTGGIVLAAKNAEALRILNAKIKAGELHKQYLCLVHGRPNPASATLRAYMRKDSEKNMVTVYLQKPQNIPVKEMITAYRVKGTRGDISLLEVDLITGRTHQIRAHLAAVGHPLLGDGKYGINRAAKGKGYKFQALCAYRLSFRFTSESGILSYLDGKSVEIPSDAIWFVRDFTEGKLS